MEWRKLHNEELNDLYSCDKIEKSEMSGKCSTYGGEERRIQGFGRETLSERDHLGDTGVDGRIILRWNFRMWNGGGMDWFELAQDRDRWRALVNGNPE